MKKIYSLFLIILFSPFVLAKAPDLGPVPPLKFVIPKPQRRVLKNGVIVYLLEDHELPLFDFRIQMKMSPADDAAGKYIDADFLSGVWRTGGTAARTPEKLNEELETMAAQIETGVGEEAATVGVSCLSKEILKVLPIFADVLFHPEFRQQKLDLAKGQALEGLRRKNDTPYDIGRRVIRDTLFGKDHYYAHRLTPALIAKVKRRDLQDLYKRILAPDQAIIAAAGDFDSDQLINDLENIFKDWKPKNRTLALYDYTLKNPAVGNIFYVEKDFNQSRVFIGKVGVARHNPDYFPLEVANTILGGGGPSRLFGEIRSRKGLAYMVGSFFVASKGPGLMGVVSQTKAQSTLAVIKALDEELEKFSAAPPSDEELSQAIDSLANAYVFRFEKANSVVNEYSDLEFYGYPPDFFETYLAKVKAVTAQDVQRMAKKYFNRGSMKLFIIGDQHKFEGPLKSLGDVTEIPLNTIE